MSASSPRYNLYRRPDSPMATAAQIAANRQNALKSTGPRTPAGKARVAGNATLHGLRSSKPPVLTPEEHEQLTDRLASLRASRPPASPAEDALLAQVTLAGLMLLRASRIQALAFEDPDTETALQAVGLALRYEAAWTGVRDRAIAGLVELRSAPGFRGVPPGSPARALELPNKPNSAAVGTGTGPLRPSVPPSAPAMSPELPNKPNSVAAGAGPDAPPPSVPPSVPAVSPELPNKPNSMAAGAGTDPLPPSVPPAAPVVSFELPNKANSAPAAAGTDALRPSPSPAAAAARPGLPNKPNPAPVPPGTPSARRLAANGRFCFNQSWNETS